MLAILIKEKSIDYIERDFNDYREIQKLLDCELFSSSGRPREGEVAWVDDEGLLKDNFIHAVDWNKSLIAGNILITGERFSEDQMGMISTDTQLTLDEVRQKVRLLEERSVDIQDEL